MFRFILYLLFSNLIVEDVLVTKMSLVEQQVYPC